MKLLKNITVSAFLLLLMGGISLQTASAQGPTLSKVTLTEYSDYQCPACAYFHPIVDSLKKTFGGQLKVNFRYYPLNSHQYAALAARAAEAARQQGAFYAMHSMLFENQQQWASSANPQAAFINYARKIGLDVGQFKEDLNAAETQRAVMEEKKEGRQMGVNSTPTFFINGSKVNRNPPTFKDFKALIESYIQEGS